MSESEEQIAEVDTGLRKTIITYRALLLQRVVFIFLFLYLAILLNIEGDFSYLLCSLFPVPYELVLPPDMAIIALARSLTPAEIIIVVFFLGPGDWMGWVSLGIGFIILPFVPQVMNSTNKLVLEVAKLIPKKGDNVGVHTWIFAAFSVWVTYTAFTYNFGLELKPMISLLYNLALGPAIVIAAFLLIDIYVRVIRRISSKDRPSSK